MAQPPLDRTDADAPSISSDDDAHNFDFTQLDDAKLEKMHEAIIARLNKSLAVDKLRQLNAAEQRWLQRKYAARAGDDVAVGDESIS